MQQNLFANGWHITIAIKAKMVFIVTHKNMERKEK